MRKKGGTNRTYSPEFKMMVVRGILEERLNYHEAVRHFELGHPKNSGARQMIKKWERIYLEEGAEGLMKERRGRSAGGKTGRPPKLEKSVEEDLIAQNQRRNSD